MGQFNPKRERVIGEMKNQERGYISNDSLGRDLEKKTQQAIYYLFLMDPFSIHKYKKKEGDENYSKKAAKFNIEILCTIEKGKKEYQVFDTPTPINRVDISDYSKDIVSILKVGKETIQEYDSNEELPDDLYDKLYGYIASLLEPDDDEEEYDQRYTMAYKNFAFCLDNPKIKTWGQIEYILKKIAQQANNNKDSLLQSLSDKNQCEEYIQALMSEHIVEIFVEKDTAEMIDEIALGFYKLFTRYSQDGEKVEKKNEKKSQEYEFIQPILSSIQNESRTYDADKATPPSIPKLFSELIGLEKRFFGSLSNHELKSLISLAVLYQQFEFLTELRNKDLIAPEKED